MSDPNPNSNKPSLSDPLFDMPSVPSKESAPWANDSAPIFSLPTRPLSSPFPGYDYFNSPNLMQAEGNGSMGIMFMGEAPGERENYAKLPFRPTAQAGSVFQRALNELGIDRASTIITNVSHYQPPRNWLDGAPWESSYILDGRPRNLELIRKYQPKVIVALGKTAFHELTGMHDVNVESGRGFIVRSRAEYGRIPVVPTYHPSFIIRGAKRKSVETGAKTEKESGGGWGFFSVFKRDIALAVSQISEPLVPTDFNTKEFKRYATLEDWQRAIKLCKENPNFPISYDFETPMSIAQTDESEFDQAMGAITQIQISLWPGHAIVSSWDWSLMRVFKELMELPNQKWDWNGRGFDREILRNLGIKFNGEYHDLMRMFSHWQRDLPRGLQYATSFVSPQDGPWKQHFEDDLRSYGVRDVHEPQKIGQYLLDSMSRVQHPQGWSLARGYQRHVYEFHTKVLDPLQVRGVPIDNPRRERMGAALQELEDKVAHEVDSQIPEHLKPSKQADGLKGLPSEIKEILKARSEERAEEAVKELVERGELRKITKKAMNEWVKADVELAAQALPNRYLIDNDVYVKRNFALEDKITGKITNEMRWCLLKPFNTNSSDQMLEYIQWRVNNEIVELGPEPSKTALKKCKWYVPTDYKSKKPTTGKKELDRLQERTGDQILKLTIEIRELKKMRTTYVETWKPSEDGCVHPFYDDNTGTSQLTAVRPAALTFPKHLKREIEFEGETYELGKFVRTMIVPKPRHRIIEADFKAFHVLTTGFEANDPDYMRMARLDMHSFVAATRLLNLAKHEDLIRLSDKELLGALNAFKSDKTPRYHGPGGKLVSFKFIRDKQAKPAILGYGFGMQPPRLYHENQEYISSREEAYRIMGGLDVAFPITCAWRKNIVQFAERQGGYLLAQYGGIRRFNCCTDKFPVDEDYRPRPGDTIKIGRDGNRWCFSPGDDAEAIIAYRPAHNAFGMIKETMLRLEAQGLLEKFQLILPVHDALIFHCPDEYVDECLHTVKLEMERPSEVLILPDGTGLWCEAELSISKPGKSWADMEDLKI